MNIREKIKSFLKISNFSGSIFLKDGTEVLIDGGSLDKGVKCFVQLPNAEQPVPLPDGEYTLEDDSTLVVIDGAVSDIKEPVNPEEIAPETPEETTIPETSGTTSGETSGSTGMISDEDIAKLVQEMIKTIDLKEYPWDQCIADQKAKGYDEESANKICGYIKAQNGSSEEMADVSSGDTTTPTVDASAKTLGELVGTNDGDYQIYVCVKGGVIVEAEVKSEQTIVEPTEEEPVPPVEPVMTPDQMSNDRIKELENKMEELMEKLRTTDGATRLSSHRQPVEMTPVDIRHQAIKKALKK